MNQSFAIHNSHYVSSESKRELIRKNDQLIQKLLGLRVRLVDSQSISYLFPADEQPKEKTTENEKEGKQRVEDAGGRPL